MDAVVTNSLIMLATQIASVAVKYNDSSIVAPSVENVKEHLEAFKKLGDLPTEYDEGFVKSIMGQVQDWFDTNTR